MAKQQPLSILMVEDSADDAELLLRELLRRGFEPSAVRVDTRDALHQALTSRPWDVVISDNRMPQFNASDALTLVKTVAPHVPFIVVSGTLTEEHAVEAMRAGASDFVTKDKLHRLAPAIEREMAETRRRLDQQRTAAALAESQQRLRQAQKLEAVGRLAAGVAHDFNNLLAAILSYADLILQGLPPDHPHRTDVEEIKRLAARAAGIVRHLLAFSRRQIAERRRLNLNQVVGEGLRNLRDLVGRAVTIVPQYSSTVWDIVGDPDQLEQVLANLATNARDAMPNGGILTIRTGNVVVPAVHDGHMPAKAGQYVRLDVSDTGSGIGPDALPKIFEPFFTTKDEGQGKGLGLASVYGMIEENGGAIFVDSAPGEGARFSMYFPRALDPDDPPGPSSEDA